MGRVEVDLFHRLALDFIHQNHLSHVIETYITDLLVSF